MVENAFQATIYISQSSMESLGEDPSTHIMTYHLWCSSNSLMDDSVRLCLFQRSLTGAATKWYIELKGGSFKIFNDLEMEFLTHYQFPIQYEIGTKLLTSLHQDNATHIFDHIHEWRRRHRMIKTQIPRQNPNGVVHKVPPTTHFQDIAMVGVTTEEQGHSACPTLRFDLFT
jgi:hypothetical protein